MLPITLQSRYAYSDTIMRLQDSITRRKAQVFLVLDQAAAAQTAGLSLRPTSLIVFGNPAAGTVLMQEDPLSGLDLPLKILVWDDGHHVNVAYRPAAEVAERYALVGLSIVQAMQGLLTALTNDVCGAPPSVISAADAADASDR